MYLKNIWTETEHWKILNNDKYQTLNIRKNSCNDTRLRDDSLQDALRDINIDTKIPDQMVTRL